MGEEEKYHSEDAPNGPRFEPNDASGDFVENVLDEIMGRLCDPEINFVFVVLGNTKNASGATSVTSGFALDPKRMPMEQAHAAIAAVINAVKKLAENTRTLSAASELLDVLNSMKAENESNKMLNELLGMIREENFPNPNTGEDDVPRHP